MSYPDQSTQVEQTYSNMLILLSMLKTVVLLHIFEESKYFYSEVLYNVTKVSTSNKSCSFKLSIHQKNPEKNHDFFKNITQH